MASTEPRKRHVPLDQKSLETCLHMAREGKSSKDIAQFSGQSIRTAQRIIRKTIESYEAEQVANVKLTKRGPKPSSDEALKHEVIDILSADNSLTIKGTLL
jgi:hypothetical protein